MQSRDEYYPEGQNTQRTVLALRLWQAELAAADPGSELGDLKDLEGRGVCMSILWTG